MELSGVFALALVSFVTATPHGYGVKSGAVAKAEANAAAGAFGGHPAIPLSIPSGSGFSGSFSKSSSSSFASASSSASSSSSSYTFSDTGANGIAGLGCQANNCKNSGNSGPSNGEVHHGNGANEEVHPYTNNAGDGPCTGSHCNSNNALTNKCLTGDCNGKAGNQQHGSYGLPSSSNNYNIGPDCASGLCNTPLQNGNTQNSYESPNKCTSGNCSPNQHTDTISNSNSYDVDSTGQTQSTYKVNSDKPISASINTNGETQSDCLQGKCLSGPSSGTTKPSHDHDIFIPLAPAGNEAKPIYPKPDIHLNTPYEGAACTSHDCNIPPSGPESLNGKLPTSYNVPILGTNPSTVYSDNGNNENPTGKLYDLPSYTTDSKSQVGTASIASNPSTYSNGIYPSQSPKTPAASPSCTGSNCPSLNTPTSDIPRNQASLNKPSNCKTPDCAYNPAIGNGALEYPSNFDLPKPTYTGAPTSSGSFKAPVPYSKVYPADYPSHNNYPGYEPVKYESTPSASNNIPNNNGGYTTNTGFHNAGAQLGSFDKKHDDIIKTSGQNVPAYTGGFTKPTGPINNNFDHTQSYSPLGPSKSQSHFGVSTTTQSAPLYTGGFGGSPGSFDTSSVIGTQFASSHGKEPSTGTSPHVTGISTSTGDNSGLHGILKPNGNLVPSNQNTPTGPSSLAGSHGPHGLSVSQIGANLPKPIDDNTKLPSYTGGFGGPTGILKPNEHDTPKSPASPLNNPTPTSTSCISASCNAKDVPKAGNAYQSTNGASSLTSAAADAKAVAYSGGFGGPSGFLKPFDNGKELTSSNYGNTEKDQSASHHYYNSGIESKNKVTSDVNQATTGALPNGGANADSGSNTGVHTHAGAQANAGAFASSNGYGGNYGAGTGCKSGCGSNYNSGAGQNFATSRSLGLSQARGLGDIHNNGASALTSAQSIAGASAGAGAGAGVFGAGQSFASSSATAHSSAGAAVKGGYGR